MRNQRVPALRVTLGAGVSGANLGRCCCRGRRPGLEVEVRVPVVLEAVDGELVPEEEDGALEDVLGEEDAREGAVLASLVDDVPGVLRGLVGLGPAGDRVGDALDGAGDAVLALHAVDDDLELELADGGEEGVVAVAGAALLEALDGALGEELRDALLERLAVRADLGRPEVAEALGGEGGDGLEGDGRGAAVEGVADLEEAARGVVEADDVCLLYTSPSPRD